MDEAGVYLPPAVVKTYGPQGRTPVLSEWQTRGYLSVMGGLSPEAALKEAHKRVEDIYRIRSRG